MSIEPVIVEKLKTLPPERQQEAKAHVIITGNLSAWLVNHLRRTGCIAYAVDMKVRLPSFKVCLLSRSGGDLR